MDDLEELLNELDSMARANPDLGPLLYGDAAHTIRRLSASEAALRAALEWAFPASEGFTEAFDGLVERGLLVEVPASEEYRAEWDADTMFVWAWRGAALRGGDEQT